MTLNEIINNDLKTSLKEQNKFSLSVLRMLKSSIQLESISKKHDLSDDEIISVLKKQVKIRKDSINEYTSYNRLDLADDLKKEVEILSKYLPEEMDQQAIEKIIDDTIKEVNPSGIKDIGLLMKNLVPKFNGQADMSVVNEIVRKKLN